MIWTQRHDALLLFVVLESSASLTDVDSSLYAAAPSLLKSHTRVFALVLALQMTPMYNFLLCLDWVLIKMKENIQIFWETYY